MGSWVICLPMPCSEAIRCAPDIDWRSADIVQPVLVITSSCRVARSHGAGRTTNDEAHSTYDDRMGLSIARASRVLARGGHFNVSGSQYTKPRQDKSSAGRMREMEQAMRHGSAPLIPSPFGQRRYAATFDLDTSLYSPSRRCLFRYLLYSSQRGRMSASDSPAMTPALRRR